MKTVNIITQGDTALHLVSALLMYESNRGDVYATTHSVEVDAENPMRKVIGAGVPMSSQNLARFARAVDVATAYAGFVPDNLLFTSPNLIAWWTPASTRTAWFKSTDPEVADAHGPVAHPALVFVAVPGDWFVFALRESARPGPATKLCHAPHFNVWDGGRICTGNVALPPAVGAEAIAVYEDAFFRSHFTHPNRTGAVKYKGGMKALWHDQLVTPDPVAMGLALLSAKENLKTAIERIASSNRNAR